MNDLSNAVVRNADELSDLSENDADSDVTLDETPTDDASDDVTTDDVSGDDVSTSEQYDEEEGFFNREGHFVVPERAKPAVVGSASRTHVSAKPAAKRTSRQTAEFSVQTDIGSSLASAVAPSARRKNTKRKSSEALVTSSDEEEVGGASDPVFVVKPQRVTSVMEGENVEWIVELKSPTPVGEL